MEPTRKGCLLAITQKRETPWQQGFQVDSEFTRRGPKQPREHVRQIGCGRPAPGQRWSVSGDAHGSSGEAGETMAVGVSDVGYWGLFPLVPSLWQRRPPHRCACCPSPHTPDFLLFLPAALCPKKLLTSFLVFAFLCRNGWVSLKGRK